MNGLTNQGTDWANRGGGNAEQSRTQEDANMGGRGARGRETNERRSQRLANIIIRKVQNIFIGKNWDEKNYKF